MLGPKCRPFNCVLQSSVANIHATHAMHVSQNTEQILPSCNGDTLWFLRG